MDLIDHLKKQIEQSGYPLEIEISALLDEKWDVTNTDSYYDSDEGKMRDIDINASRSLDFDFVPITLQVNLTIECKKNDNFAWVFFTRPFKYSYIDITGHWLDGMQILTKNIEKDDIMALILEKPLLHYSRVRKVAVCFDEFLIQGKKRDYRKKKEIFEAINQLKKYIIYTNEQTMKSRYPFLIQIFFPCIIFDGQMFEAKIENGEVKLRKTKHVLLISSQKAPYSTWDLGFIIDVVHRSHFKTFLRTIENNIESLKQTVKKNEEEIYSQISTIAGILQSSP